MDKYNTISIWTIALDNIYPHEKQFFHRSSFYLAKNSFTNPASTPCLRKICAKLFLSELCQMSINFDNFWQVDEKMAKIIFYVNIFHLTSLMSSPHLVKQKSSNFFT